MNILQLEEAQKLGAELIRIKNEIDSLQKIGLMITEVPDSTSIFSIEVRNVPEIVNLTPFQEMQNEITGGIIKGGMIIKQIGKRISIEASDTDVYNMLDVMLQILNGRKVLITAQLQQLGLML